jgi:2-C-methyl-D-erythritol 2,4-cyclodiphosphate synthase
MIRIGHSWDTHRLVEGRNLILGGVKIESKVGLLGHSDADCVLHSIAEALLGSLALGDLGTFYPDNSKETLDMDSKIILSECYDRIKNLGYHLVNLDLTIYAEHIKINPHRSDIRKSIANILNIDESFVSVKATTYEGMSFIGKDLAIASECCLLVESND